MLEEAELEEEEEEEEEEEDDDDEVEETSGVKIAGWNNRSGSRLCGAVR